MCRAFKELMEDKRREGKIEGISEGKIEGMREGKRKGKCEGKREEKAIIIKRMIKEGLDEALISRVTRCTKEEYAMALGK